MPARNYGHDLNAMLAAIAPGTRIVFIARSKQSSWQLSSGIGHRTLARVPSNVVVVLDEAYTEYLPVEQRSNSMAWLAKAQNLVITRTFSKAYGLAGHWRRIRRDAPGSRRPA